ncbi:MAG: chitobiase/beta-hexosaminidase C-terminal domain-containing protein [Defluviitaleaceae bacterium]|nr:chitobiase/beta-hexosaminidase C-terminal domain-containing protein [Defluviitaleaceae bacterium]
MEAIKAMNLSFKDRITKRIVAIFLAVIMVAALLFGWMPNRDVAAVGTRSPYSIANAAELRAMSIDGTYYLYNPFTVNLAEHPPNFEEFRGTLDGRGFEITFTGSYLIRNSATPIYWGPLFRSVNGGVIENLDVNLSNVSIIVEDNSMGTPNITSNNRAYHDFPNAFLGGIVGSISGNTGLIENSSVTGQLEALRDVSGHFYSGNTLGVDAVLELRSSYYIGGITGRVAGGATVNTCLVYGLNLVANTGTLSNYVYPSASSNSTTERRHIRYFYHVFAGNIAGHVSDVGSSITNNLIEGGGIINIGGIRNDNFVGYVAGIWGRKDNVAATGSIDISGNLLRNITLSANSLINSRGYVALMGGFFDGTAQLSSMDANYIYEVEAYRHYGNVRNFFDNILNHSIRPISSDSLRMPTASELNGDRTPQNHIWIENSNLVAGGTISPELIWRTVPLYGDQRGGSLLFTNHTSNNYGMFRTNDNQTLAFDLYVPTIMHRGPGDWWHSGEHPHPGHLNFRVYKDVPGQLAAPMLEWYPGNSLSYQNRFRLSINNELSGSPQQLGINDNFRLLWYVTFPDSGVEGSSIEIDDFMEVDDSGIIDLTNPPANLDVSVDWLDEDIIYIYVKTEFTANSGTFVSNSFVRRFILERRNSLFIYPLTTSDSVGETMQVEIGAVPVPFTTSIVSSDFITEFDIPTYSTTPPAFMPAVATSDFEVRRINSTDANIFFRNNNNEYLNSIILSPTDTAITAFFESRPCTEFDIDIIPSTNTNSSELTVLISDYTRSDLGNFNPFENKLPGILATPVIREVRRNSIYLEYPDDTGFVGQPTINWRYIGGQCAIVLAMNTGIGTGSIVIPNLDESTETSLEFEIWSTPSLEDNNGDYSFVSSPRVSFVAGIKHFEIYPLTEPDSDRYDGLAPFSDLFRYRGDGGYNNIYFIQNADNLLQFRYTGRTITDDALITIQFWYGNNRSQIHTIRLYPDNDVPAPPTIEPQSWNGRWGETLENITITGTPNTTIYFRLGFCYTANPCDECRTGRYGPYGTPRNPNLASGPGGAQAHNPGSSNFIYGGPANDQPRRGFGTRRVVLDSNGELTIEWRYLRQFFVGRYMWITAVVPSRTDGDYPEQWRSNVITRTFHYTQKVPDDPLIFINPETTNPIDSFDSLYFFDAEDIIIIRAPDNLYIPTDGIRIHTATGGFPISPRPQFTYQDASQDDPLEWEFVITPEMITGNRLTLSAEYRRTNFPTRRPPSEVVLNTKFSPQPPIPSSPTNSRIPTGYPLSFFLHADDYVWANRVYYVHRDTVRPVNFTGYTLAQLRTFEAVRGNLDNYRPIIIVHEPLSEINIRMTMPELRYRVYDTAEGGQILQSSGTMQFPLPEIWHFNPANSRYSFIAASEFPASNVPLPNTITLQGTPSHNIRVETEMIVPPNSLRHAAYPIVENTFIYRFYNQLPTPRAIPEDMLGSERATLPFDYVVYLISEGAPDYARIFYTKNTGLDPRIRWCYSTIRYIIYPVDCPYTREYSHTDGISGRGGGENGRININAVVVAPGWERSQIARFNYYVRNLDRVLPPNVFPATGTAADGEHTVVAHDTRISLFAANANAQIMFGTNGEANELYRGNLSDIRAVGRPGDSFTLTAMAFYRVGDVITGEPILEDSETVTFIFRIEDQVTAAPPTSWPVTSPDNIPYIQRGNTVTLQSPNGLPIIYSLAGHPDPRHVEFDQDGRLVHVNNNAATTVTRIYDSATAITIEGALGDMVNISAMAIAAPTDQNLRSSEIVNFAYNIEARQVATPIASPTTDDGVPRVIPNNSLVTLRTPTGSAYIYYSTIGIPVPGRMGTNRIESNSGTVEVIGAPGSHFNIRTLAVADDMIDSDIALFTFQIEDLQVVQPPTAWPQTTPEETTIVPLGSRIFLQSETPNATIHYSRTGTPNRHFPEGGILVEGTPGTTFRIHAEATAPGMQTSNTVIFTYQIAELNVVIPPTAWPRTTPENTAVVPLGSYIVLQTETPNATIQYSRAGVPNRNFPTGGIPVEGTPGSTFRIHARATAPGMRESDVVIFTYQIADLNVVQPPTAWPQTTPEVEEIALVALGSHIFLQSDTPDAVIYYSHTGMPDRAFPNDGILVEGITGSTFRIHAQARVPGMRESDIVIFTYQIENMNTVAAPIASPETGDGEPTIIQRGASIRLRSPTVTATIFYSLEGIPVVEGGSEGNFQPAEGTNQLDTSQIVTVPEDWEGEFFILNAIAVAEGLYDSDIATFTYRLPASVHPVQANPSSRTVVRGTEVTLSTATNYATIYFETAAVYEELTDPVPGESQVFGLPIIIESDIHIRAVAAREGEFSRVTTFSYTVADQLMAPVPSIPSGSIVPRGTMLELTTTEGASITYTKDGSDPTNPENPSRMHGSTIALDAEAGQSISISAFAHMTGQTPSEIVSFTYSVLDINAAVVAHPPSGSDVHAGSWVTLATQITGAEIRYAVRDADLGSNARRISSGGRVQVTGSPGETFIIRAQAVSGSIESMPMMFYYTISARAHPPNPSILDGTRVTQGTRLAFSVPNGVVYYRVDNTLNGLRTTGSLQTYTGPFVLQGDPGTEIRVTAFTRAEGLEDSEERVFVYHMSNQTAPPLAMQILNDGITNHYVAIGSEINNVDRRQGVMISLSSSTPDAAIYYTSNGMSPPHGSPEWIRYEGPFSVHRSVTLNMFAVAPDMDPSENQRQHIRINFVGDDDEDEMLDFDDDMDFVLVYTHLETDVQLRMRVTEEWEDPILPEGVWLEVVRLDRDHDAFIGIRDRVVRANLNANGSEVVDVQVVDLYEIHIYVEENGVTRRISNGFDEGSVRIGIPLQDSYRDAIVRIWHVPNENELPNPLHTIRRGSRGTIFVQPSSFSHFAVVVPLVSGANQNQGFNPQLLLAIPLLGVVAAGSVYVIKRKKKNSYAPLIENETE